MIDTHVESDNNVVEEWPIQVAKFGRNLTASEVSASNLSFDVKVCKFASKELDIGHNSVDFTKSLFKNTFDANEKFHEKATLCIFAKAHEYKCEHVNQNGMRCNGVPKLGELTQISGSVTLKKKFIGCTNWKSNEKGYRYLTISINVDLELLEKMFNDYSYHSHGIDFQINDESDAVEECFMVQSNSARSDECPFLHKIGNHIVKGVVSRKAGACPVIFYHIVLENLKEYPFIVTILVGQHNHPPPPP
ncbi:unnamed protein product [Rhizophagus irregularis]|uniref:Uncharacterized protein n=1 Tax=Rhizophagus irregularis TaxID=588596 RepID=A0A2I1GCD9_9GLOM|nr:hypothetical protein RhiirA4_458541 [Rhizophagus irregularis]CAB4408773.1 unnamed protein product [Rhizophagus irregularis]